MKKQFVIALAALLCAAAAVPAVTVPVCAVTAQAEEETPAVDAEAWLSSAKISSWVTLYDAKKDSSFKMSGRTYQRGILFGYGGQTSHDYAEEAAFDVSGIKKLSFYVGHVDSNYCRDGALTIKLDGVETETIEIPHNITAKLVELDVSKAKELVFVGQTSDGSQVAVGNISVDGSKIEAPASAPKYSTPEQMLGASYNRIGTTIYSKTDKSESFKMQGRTFYQGAAFSATANGQFVINTENAKKLSLTLGHIDNTKMNGGTFKFFHDNVYNEEETVELTASQGLKTVEIDVTDTKCLTVVVERAGEAGYGLGDLSMDDKACANPCTVPSGTKPEQLLKASFNRTGIELYEGADKSTSFKSIGRTYYQGMVLTGGLDLKQDDMLRSEVMMNVEKSTELKFTACHVDGTAEKDAVLKIYLDGELDEDNIITLTGNMLPKEYTLDVKDTDLVRIVVDYKKNSKFALGSFSANGTDAAIPCAKPTYATPEKLLAAVYDTDNAKLYSKGDKSESFNMNGRTYYQGVACSGGSTSMFRVNTENVKKIGYTVSHIDGSAMSNGKVKVYLDNEFSEKDSYDVKPNMLWDQHEIDTSKCSVVTFVVERENGAAYGLGDFTVDGKEPANSALIPTYETPERMLNASFNRQRADIYDAEDTTRTFEMGGETFNKGVVFQGGNSWVSGNVNYINFNVENYMLVSFKLGAVSADNSWGEVYYMRVLLDGDEVFRRDGITPNMENEELSFNVGNASVMRVEVSVSGADKYGLAGFKIDEKPEFLKGDLDGDWAVSVQDAQLALKAYTRQVADLPHGLTEQQFRAADVTGDEQLSVDDAQYILKYYTNNSVALLPTTWEELIKPKTEEPKTEEPKSEEPKTEEPKTEEPKSEETKTEEPKSGETKTDEKADAKSETK